MSALHPTIPAGVPKTRIKQLLMIADLARASANGFGVANWPHNGLTNCWLLAILVVALTQGLAAEGKYFTATNLWQFRIDGGNRSSPALGQGGTIYIGTWEGDLIALNPEGTERWRFKTRYEVASSPAIGPAGTVYVGCRDRRLYALDQDGRKQWAFKTGGWVDASAAIGTNGTIYFGSWDKKFYALNPDGSRQWEFLTGGPVVSSAAIDTHGVIYFGSHDRKFYALNPDGSKRWDYATEGAITCSPAIGTGGELYFASVDGMFHAVNPDGTRRWILRTGGITGSSPVLGADGTIFVSVNLMHCAITPDGKYKWQRELWNEWQISLWNLRPGFFGETAAAVLANGHVVFTGGDAYVMTVPGDKADKEWVWNYFLNGASYSSPLVAVNGTIYVMSIGQDFSALQRDVPLATTSWPMFRGNPQHTGRVNTK